MSNRADNDLTEECPDCDRGYLTDPSDGLAGRKCQRCDGRGEIDREAEAVEAVEATCDELALQRKRWQGGRGSALEVEEALVALQHTLDTLRPFIDWDGFVENPEEPPVLWTVWRRGIALRAEVLQMRDPRCPHCGEYGGNGRVLQPEPWPTAPTYSDCPVCTVPPTTTPTPRAD